MPIRYSLIENKLTADPNDLRGRVQHAATVTIQDVIQKIARPGSTVTVAEALAFWEELSQAIVNEVQAGNRFNSDLFSVSLGLEGTFDAPTDPFDPLRHALRIRTSPGVRLRKAERDLRVEQVRADPTLPILEDVEDFTTDARNDQLTPGGTARLTGDKLKFDPTDPEQGLFLVATNGTTTKIAKVKTNKPSEQLFVVPATVAAGAGYRLEVRAKNPGSTNLRVGALGTVVRVV